MRGRAAWAFIAPLLGVAACANVWGFQDLTASDGGPPDATSMTDAPVAAQEAGAGDAEADAADQEGDSHVAGEDARSDGPIGDAGDGGGVSREGGPADGGNAGDSAAVALCETICTMGCCDSQGICHSTTTTKVCGPAGTACQDCSTHTCSVLTETPCCGTSGCACQSILGCN